MSKDEKISCVNKCYLYHYFAIKTFDTFVIRRDSSSDDLIKREQIIATSISLVLRYFKDDNELEGKYITYH